MGWWGQSRECDSEGDIVLDSVCGRDCHCVCDTGLFLKVLPQQTRAYRERKVTFSIATRQVVLYSASLVASGYSCEKLKHYPIGSGKVRRYNHVSLYHDAHRIFIRVKH